MIESVRCELFTLIESSIKFSSHFCTMGTKNAKKTQQQHTIKVYYSDSGIQLYNSSILLAYFLVLVDLLN